MQKKTKVILVSVFGFLVVLIVALIITRVALDKIAKEKATQLQFEIERDLAAATLSANMALSPKIENIAGALQLTFEVPEDQEIEINTQIEDQTLKVSGKLIITIDRVSDGYRGTATSTRDFSYSFDLKEPVDKSNVVVTNDGDKVIVFVPKLN